MKHLGMWITGMILGGLVLLAIADHFWPTWIIIAMGGMWGFIWGEICNKLYP